MPKTQYFTLCETSTRSAHLTLQVEIPEGVTEEQVSAELDEYAEEAWDSPGDFDFECGAVLKSHYPSEEHIEPLDVYHRKDCVGMK